MNDSTPADAGDGASVASATGALRYPRVLLKLSGEALAGDKGVGFDFDRIGSWQYSGDFDDLTTNAELLRDQFVRLGDAQVLATRITADEFFAVTIDDANGARGIRIPTD